MIQITEIEKYLSDIKYELDRFDRSFADRGKIVDKAKSLMEPCYVHLWMIMYPIKGYEKEVESNIGDLSEWLYQLADKCYKTKVQVLGVYEPLSDSYLRRVKSELQNHHKYPHLVGISGFEISDKMADIIGKIDQDIKTNRKRSKSYMIDKSKIQSIIKEVCDIE